MVLRAIAYRFTILNALELPLRTLPAQSGIDTRRDLRAPRFLIRDGPDGRRERFQNRGKDEGAGCLTLPLKCNSRPCAVRRSSPDCTHQIRMECLLKTSPLFIRGRLQTSQCAYCGRTREIERFSERIIRGNQIQSGALAGSGLRVRPVELLPVARHVQTAGRVPFKGVLGLVRKGARRESAVEHFAGNRRQRAVKGPSQSE